MTEPRKITERFPDRPAHAREWSISGIFTDDATQTRYATDHTIIGDRAWAEASFEKIAAAIPNMHSLELAEIDAYRNRLTPEEWAEADAEMRRVAIHGKGSTGEDWFDEKG